MYGKERWKLGLKVNINKTKLMVMSRESGVTLLRVRWFLHCKPYMGTWVRFAVKELEQTQYGVNVVKGGATRDVWGSEI